MRLLTWDCSGCISFTRDLAEHDLPRYAILSHTWGAETEEVTLQDVKDGSAANKPGYKKVKFCAEQAERDGLQHCWVDSCCIDKTNLVELDKSIRSMFRWYQKAHKCYVYLSDVPLYDFQRSRWFKRGWTLQELLAPHDVVFFDNTGKECGTKASREQHISAATQIPVNALKPELLAGFSITERFLWQQGRDTTVPEDLAYSLLGLFGVSMPIMYGEGYVAARQRLEEEIRKTYQGTRHADFSVVPTLNDVVQVQHFIGRSQELRAIRDALHSDGSRKYVTIYGLGGMGKTQLALEYATRFKDLYSTILWLNIDSQDTVQTSFVKVAKHMLLQPVGAALGIAKSETNADSIVQSVNRWLSQPGNTRWLMIFDNYDNPKVPGNKSPAQVDIREYLPSAYQGSIIITTRSGDVQLGYTLRLTKLERLEESMQLLSTTSGRMELADDLYANQLIQELDGLPLALATAGAYLSQSSLSLDRYVQLYRKSWAKLQQTSSALSTYEDRKLYSTWQITFDQIKDKSPTAANFLRLSAYFSNENIWLQLLQHHNDKDPPWIAELTRDELDFEAAAQTLCRYGLLEKASTAGHQNESNGYSMHKCVHSWVSSVLEGAKDSALMTYALRCVAAHVPGQEESEWWITQRWLLSHASICIESYVNGDDHQFASVPWGWHNLGNLYHDQGQLAQAEKMYRRALGGPGKALRTVNSLAILYCDQGKFAEAGELLKQALAGCEKALGAEHTSTLITINNLGNLYLDQGKVVEAEEMFEQVLAWCKKAVGAVPTWTLTTVNNLGNLYCKQGKLAEAEEMFTQALDEREKALGVEHTMTLETVNSLGNLYRHQRKLAKAEEMYMRALTGYEKALGAEHISTLTTVDNLANLYRNQRKLAKAEEMCKRALVGREKALGEEHGATIETVNHLGMLYCIQGKLAEAEEMYMRALAGKDTALGPEHTSTLETVDHLGLLYCIQGKLAKAEETFKRALAGRERTLGAQHSSTLETVEHLGMVYCNQGKLSNAEKMYMRALAGYEKALGAEHESALQTVNNLGMIYHNQGKLAGAEEMFMRLYAGRKKALGPDHPHTLDSMHELASISLELGKLEASQQLATLCYEARLRLFGEGCTQTQESTALLTAIASKMETVVKDDTEMQAAMH